MLAQGCSRCESSWKPTATIEPEDSRLPQAGAKMRNGATNNSQSRPGNGYRDRANTSDTKDLKKEAGGLHKKNQSHRSNNSMKKSSNLKQKNKKDELTQRKGARRSLSPGRKISPRRTQRNEQIRSRNQLEGKNTTNTQSQNARTIESDGRLTKLINKNRSDCYKTLMGQ